jgi:hypothetical protein
MTSSLFRMLIIASVVISLLGSAIETMIGSPNADVGVDDLSGLPVWASVPFYIVGGIALIGGLAALYGLYTFRPWSRWLMLWCAGGLLLLGTFIGTFIGKYESQHLAIVDALDTVSMMMNGAILAAAYWSPISSRFERNSN